ncbi:amino-acid N-acetyltransferase [Neisseria lisongii]|uniref:Amino-acid acetyltransferase n=1 Tax=Neisseria lisongii TaxID=2912188 RepID=A0AAW5AG52_9NEIS|nr:amino-acid N-acetyltransferase [Neisseria lisongii]MCF7529077.1 amino-acid N-acetyltransferase [Neisseria lisongii]
MNPTRNFVSDFREAAPYIHYLRGKTLVVGTVSGLLAGEPLKRLAADFNLLASLGVRLVWVHGARCQIDQVITEHGGTPQYYRHRRITDDTALTHAKYAVGALRYDIEAALCSSLPQSPRRSKPLTVAAGNFLSARPLGVIDGIDMGYSGVIRKIDTEAVLNRLDQQALVLISPMGYSLSGKTFSLDMYEAAAALAVALKAEKLIYLVGQDGILDSEGRLKTNLSAQEATDLAQQQPDSPQSRLLRHAVHAVENGVTRSQILNGYQDGGLLQELFTRNGSGTSIARNAFAKVRQADSLDIPDIMALIRPLEEQGILVRRSQAYLETHIHTFCVLEHDRHIYGCAALKTFAGHNSGEIACLAVSPDTRDGGCGERLLEHLCQAARSQGLTHLFALSTHTGEWFVERGFQPAAPETLPPERYQEYTANGRNSKVFVYPLGETA